MPPITRMAMKLLRARASSLFFSPFRSPSTSSTEEMCREMLIDLTITTRMCSCGTNFKVIGQIEVGLVKSGEEAIHNREGIHAIKAGLIIQNYAMVQHG